MPLVSVIMPAHNADQTIADSLRSILAQTWQDWEAIVADDASSDRTAEEVAAVAAEDRHNRIHYLRLEPTPKAQSHGPSAARNRAIDAAVGEFFAFLDADDLWSPEALADRLGALQANPAAGLAYSWTDCIDESGQFARPGGHITCEGEVYPRLLVQNFLENGSAAIVRRSALETVGGFDESLRFGEDWDLWLRLAARYPFVAIPKVQVLYRVARYASSSQVQAFARDVRFATDRAFDQAPPQFAPLRSRSLANLYEYLYFKTLSGALRRRSSLVALPFLARAWWYDRHLRARPGLVGRALWKLVAIALFPQRLAHRLLNRFGNAALAHVEILQCIRSEL